MSVCAVCVLEGLGDIRAPSRLPPDIATFFVLLPRQFFFIEIS